MTFFINLFFLLTFIPIGITFFSMKLRKKIVSIIIFILGVSLCTIVDKNVSPLSWYLFPLSFLCIALTLYSLFKTRIRTLLLAELVSYFVISALNQLARLICSSLSLTSNKENQFSILIQSIIVFLLVFSISSFVQSKQTTERDLSFPYIIFFTAVVIIDASVITVIGNYLFNKIANINLIRALSIYSLLIIGVLIQIILLIRMIKSRDQHKENEKLAKQYLENQTRYYEYLVQREEDTKKFRHDIRNHINMLNILFQEKKIDECQKYLMDLTTHYENIHNAISVNNCIADAILNQYFFEAKLHNITLNVSGHFPPQCDLSAYDICTIFSNLLDNALKAVIDCNGKNISIGCRYTETEILLSIENDSNHVKLDSNGMPRTSQKDYSQHGFGLKNVHQCVIQNNGHITIQAENNQFKVMLSLGRGINNENCNNR